ncbi:hypothetical protein [Pseudoalteromonas aurantia]|uniref:Glycosyl transferase n=1 Tax=Pseudoalteromonas aurantia TaxID=43654 RepID=A0A5S3V9Z6_9GAMM|nr:hypothetical protein [Pseudoalteromonas aurantia]TMO67681.1 hypothetical protein CWC18_00300 [Pseudoalteromonas aurantia]TMO68742.1 hypothetical protein CWC19_08225 [Pseudoalteromonas aurantia]TMO78932.1 hypothetical protein CWC20_00550 [Pseudoalteromonas aurantia]
MIEKGFVYVLYGKQLRHYNEAIGSISTLLLHNPNAKVIVLAEMPDFFSETEQVTIVKLDDALKSQWLSKSDYHFRLKLSGLRYLLENYVKVAIFLDSDTLVKKNIMHYFNEISSKQSVLHKLEGHLSKKRFSRQYKNALDRTFSHPEYGDYHISKSDPMYNSGFIGVDQSHLDIFDTALWLMEEISQVITFHTAEQFALGLLLMQKGNILTVGDGDVYHYWHKKPRLFIHEELKREVENNSVQKLLESPFLSKGIRARRPFLRWLQDKVH